MFQSWKLEKAKAAHFSAPPASAGSLIIGRQFVKLWSA
jgi:hypothetical protein